MARAGDSAIESFAHFGDPADVRFVREFMDRQQPTAVICCNDRIAALLIQSLTELGIRVPLDVGIVGFDDVRYATLLASPLTTMRQPCREIGRAAVSAMLQRLDQPDLFPRQILISAELIIRRSCTAPRLAGPHAGRVPTQDSRE